MRKCGVAFGDEVSGVTDSRQARGLEAEAGGRIRWFHFFILGY